MALVALIVVPGMAQTVKMSAFATDSVQGTQDYLVGVRGSGVSWTNKKFVLPRGGVLQRDEAGMVTATRFDTLLERMRGPVNGVGIGNDTLMAVLTWKQDTVSRCYIVTGVVQILNPALLKTAPLRTRINLFFLDDVTVRYSAPVLVYSNSTTFQMLQYYSVGGYYSTCDFYMDDFFAGGSQAMLLISRPTTTDQLYIPIDLIIPY